MALLRKSDTVARVGGDEFVILLPEVAQDDYAATAARKILSDFHQPFVIGGHDLHITSSIGVAAYPHDGEEAVALRKNADVAMYRAKALGRDNCQFFANQ
jgi:diguanylate cyclase (GGDEF)-like protein